MGGHDIMASRFGSDFSELKVHAEVGPEGGQVPADIARAIQTYSGQGAGLSSDDRSAMETGFGTGFGDVRLHTDAGADNLCRRLGARAFTTGHDIFVRQGLYSPRSRVSRQLLAHEMAHVVQQRGVTTSGPMTVGRAGDTYEMAADAASRGATDGHAAVGRFSGGAPTMIQRQADDCTYGEIRSHAVTSVRDFTAPAGLADAKASIGAVCGREQICNCVDGSTATAPADQHAWSNIVAATGGTDRTGGGNYMCVGSQACAIVTHCTGCQNGHPHQQRRATNLTPTGTVSVGGYPLYFYSDADKGWCSHDLFIHGCHPPPRRRVATPPASPPTTPVSPPTTPASPPGA